MKARYLLAGGLTLSKKTVNWKVPCDLMSLSAKNKRTYIGIGKWSNTKGKYCVITKKGIAIYLEKEIIGIIKKGLG